MNEQETRTTRSSRTSKKQQKTTILAVIAIVLLLIGGFVGSAMQKGSANRAKKELEQARIEFNKELDVKDTKIAALEAEIAAKQKELDEAGTAAPVGADNEEPSDINTEDENVNAPETQSTGGGWFGKLVIVFIIIALIITALFVAYNAFTKDRDDDDEYDDDEDDDDYYDDDEDDDEYEEDNEEE